VLSACACKREASGSNSHKSKNTRHKRLAPVGRRHVVPVVAAAAAVYSLK